MNAKQLFFIGVILILVGLGFNIAETWYFGWNLRPQSPEEMICDYVSISSILIGWLIILYAMRFAKEQTTVKYEVLCPHGYCYDDCPDCRH